MELALIHNNSLVLCPVGFSVFRINSELEDLEVEERINPKSYLEIPIHFSDGLTHLVALEKEIPEHDGNYHNVGNFSWEIVEENGVPTKVKLTYPIFEKTLEEVKNYKKQEVAPVRRGKENTTINLTVNNTEIQVSTTRDERTLLATKLSSLTGTCNYKFNNTWVEVSASDLQYILDEIDSVIQQAFDWEFSKLQEIDACQTIDEVYAIVVR